MLVGVLMKQAAIAIVLSVLLYCYSLIMGTADSVLPWALKILMIALVTVAVFIYRKPFSHLFSAVGYGTLGSTERAEYSLREAGYTFRRSTLGAATAAVPGMASYRAARWARRNPGQAPGVGAAPGAGPADATAAGTAAGTAAEAAGTTRARSGDAYASRLRPDAPPAADGEVSSGSRRVVSGVSGSGSARARNAAEADQGSGRVAPPLDLPPRPGTGAGAGAGAPGGSPGLVGSASGWSRGAGRSAGAGTGAGAGSGTGPHAGARARASSGGWSAPPISGGGSAPGPAWPSSGWPAAGARQRSGARPRPAPKSPPPAEPADQGGRADGETPAMPFWLRPIRRDK